MQLIIRTKQKRQVVDITEQVADELPTGNGVVNVFVMHTTAAVTTADLDPGTDQDYLNALERMTPDGRWHHPHDPGHFPDHLWSSVIGPEVTVPFSDGRLVLGAWQRVVLIELDGPRDRHVEITVISA